MEVMDLSSNELAKVWNGVVDFGTCKKASAAVLSPKNTLGMLAQQCINSQHACHPTRIDVSENIDKPVVWVKKRRLPYRKKYDSIVEELKSSQSGYVRDSEHKTKRFHAVATETAL